MELDRNSRIHSNIIRQILILSLVIGLGILLYEQMAFMTTGALGAITLYTLMRKPMFVMVYQWKTKRWVAAIIMIVLSLLVIVFPFALIIDVLVSKLAPLMQDTSRITNTLERISAYINNKFQIDIMSQANLDRIPAFLTQFGTKVIGSTLNMVVNVVVMYFILWFMLVKSAEMEKSIRNNLPLKFTNTNILLHEVQGMVFSNAIGIPVLGLCQGILAALGYYIFDVDQPVLWGIMTGIASVVPFLGTTLVWLPVALLKFAEGDNQSGWWLLFWGAVVIGSSDNIIRFVLQKFIADIHPLVTVFGVILGLNLFGFLGLIFGPLLISLFMLLTRIYLDEFTGKAGGQNPKEVEETAQVS